MVFELQHLLDAFASADAAIVMSPGVHLTLAGMPLKCSYGYEISVTGSDGATIDGGDRTNLFHIEGGCKLSLNNIRLVSG